MKLATEILLEQNTVAMKSALDWIRTAIKDEDETKLDIAIDRLEKAISANEAKS